MLRQKHFLSIPTALKLVFLQRRAYRRQKDISLFHINWLQNSLPLLGTGHPALVTVLGSDYGLLKLPGMTTILRRVFKERRCIIAPNAEWMKSGLEQRFGDVARVIPIPLGLNEEWYSIKREIPPTDKYIWLVVCRLTDRKIGRLFEWGENIFLKSPKHELHLFGPMQEKLNVPGWIHYHGATNPQELCKEWFPRATGLITLSQHDEGRPQVMLEAMAAGLPIIATNLPAHKNIIVHKKTGLLVESSEEFARGLEWMADPVNNLQIAAEARNWVKHEVGNWADCAKRYIGMYQMLLDGAE